MEMLHMPIFIAFLEKNYTQSEISKQLVGRLSVMAHEFPRILFSYIDKPDLYFLRNKVSITWEELPSLGLFNNEGMMPIVFPRNQPFTIPNLRAFFGAFMNGTTYNASFTLPNLNLNYGENMKHAFQVQLSNSSSLSSNESGISRLQNHTIDTLLLMFNSSNSFLTNYQITEMYEMIASLFSNIGASTVDFAYLDVGKSTVPKYLQSNETLPHIQFLPAFNKGEISFKNIGSLNIGDIIQYVRKNAKTDLIEAFKTFDLMYGSQEIVTEDIIDSDKVELLEDL